MKFISILAEPTVPHLPCMAPPYNPILSGEAGSFRGRRGLPLLKLKRFSSLSFKMEEVEADQLKLNGRYFVREGNETYFGTFIGKEGDHIRIVGGNINSPYHRYH